MKKFKVGDEVKFRWNDKVLSGKIIKIDKADIYPIKVRSGSIFLNFTKDGRYREDEKPRLKHIKKKEKSLIQKLAKWMEKGVEVGWYDGFAPTVFRGEIRFVGKDQCICISETDRTRRHVNNNKIRKAK